MANLENLASLYNSKYSAPYNEPEKTQNKNNINVGVFGSIFKQNLEEKNKHLSDETKNQGKQRPDKNEGSEAGTNQMNNNNSSRVEMLPNTSRPETPVLNSSQI